MIVLVTLWGRSHGGRPAGRGELWTSEEPRYLQGWLSGGHGETSTLTAEPPWGAGEGKISAAT